MANVQSYLEDLLDQARSDELEFCCQFIINDRSCGTKFQRAGLAKRLRLSRKPKTIKENALDILSTLKHRNDIYHMIQKSDLDVIKAALEQVED